MYQKKTWVFDIWSRRIMSNYPGPITQNNSSLQILVPIYKISSIFSNCVAA